MLRNDARNDRRRRTAVRRGFTLVEMLVVVTILGLLSGMVLVALAGAAESAREARTRTQIAKLNEFIMNKYESFRTRRTPQPSTSSAFDLGRFDKNGDLKFSAREIQGARVDNIRGLMVQELPDRKTDLQTPYAPGGAFTATYARHQRAVMAFRNASDWPTAYAGWSEENQQSECLYLILASITDGETNATEFLHDSEIGDTDDDGVPEVLDGWGNPIAFLRWPQGYIGFESSLQDIRTFDSFDPLRTRTQTVQIGTSYRPQYHPLDPNTSAPTTFLNFNLTPLIVSAGKDGIFDIMGDDSATSGGFDTAHGITGNGGTGPVRYMPYPIPMIPPPINPYSPTVRDDLQFTGANGAVGVGAVRDVNGDGYDNSIDNISSHYLVVGGNAP
ncbi:prepilin-type N-terminal cleavage/methylation domain-containing protein [Blastopirellula sp. JC732]|uniref:Prepilin-type N-terminal cleavage/methylation domain-containing protein n=1 Tax=Blastopirellula sediminis TaxID=2894196 RepID=A0A9X1MLX5_9BACT|nr:prepilin-type N-terminal cleavage/methylation domain-containing protein [Blastopirellula sediminis]MCC9609304.1 prepilin-type N-terminal cleavage/methylation domain-containing protein [Blastopirellula sediminis]MCC9627919.1 prepilin-type N-terminal cleavage/methylation domain-containing protein [Blastopirellula sediminis]